MLSVFKKKKQLMFYFWSPQQFKITLKENLKANLIKNLELWVIFGCCFTFWSYFIIHGLYINLKSWTVDFLWDAFVLENPFTSKTKARQWVRLTIKQIFLRFLLGPVSRRSRNVFAPAKPQQKIKPFDYTEHLSSQK